MTKHHINTMRERGHQH